MLGGVAHNTTLVYACQDVTEGSGLLHGNGNNASCNNPDLRVDSRADAKKDVTAYISMCPVNPIHRTEWFGRYLE